ncbi:MAG: phospho-sugar mutase [Anaerolineae bacterium]
MADIPGLDPTISRRVLEWLEGPYDEKTKEDIRLAIRQNPKSLIDAFYTDLSFGTGGLRGLMGIGTDRMNQYTVCTATQGLANNILKSGPYKSPPKVLIGFDSRHHSHTFATYAARVLAANGIGVYLLKDLRPTPFISFALRHKKALSGIMITASHNPKDYNGYKVYWSDGAQTVPPHDTGIIAEVHRVQSFAHVKIAEENHPLIEIINGALDEAYLSAIRPLQLFPVENKQYGSDLKIIYTSLHGTGITIVPKALNDWGFTSIHFVKEQIIPDGDFPTVKFPNPEFKEALQLGMDLLQKTSGDLLIATDPDADRMGIVVMHDKALQVLTGNEIAALCSFYLCQQLKEHGKLKPNAAIITTIVSTELLKAIASSFKVNCFEVLTGFKYIGEKIHQWEMSKENYEFIFGAEESYGYLYGTHARDKDAIISSCLISEIALFCKRAKKTLLDLLDEIYKNYGIFRESQVSLNFKAGKEGMDQMTAVMAHLRKKTPLSFANLKVIKLEDYEQGVRHDISTQKQEPLNLPKSDVLLFWLEDGSKIVVRPSGTEPKIKIYGGVQTHSFTTIQEGIASCDKRLDDLLKSIQEDLKTSLAC